MIITKQHLKLLTFIYQNKSIKYSKLEKKLKNSPDEILETLIFNRYIEQLGGSITVYGEPIPFESGSIFKLTDLGTAEVESNQWFDFRYILTNIIVPILVGVFSSLITAVILLLI